MISCRSTRTNICISFSFSNVTLLFSLLQPLERVLIYVTVDILKLQQKLCLHVGGAVGIYYCRPAASPRSLHNGYRFWGRDNCWTKEIDSPTDLNVYLADEMRTQMLCLARLDLILDASTFTSLTALSYVNFNLTLYHYHFSVVLNGENDLQGASHGSRCHSHSTIC